MSHLAQYLQELAEVRSSGEAVPETSYYPALSNLLQGVGKALKPRVFCILTPKDRGAGEPDGALFTEEQMQKREGQPLPGQMPGRGVVEVKGTANDAWVTADGPQVTRRQVLVTNLRDFVLVGQDLAGNQVKLETFRLAPTEREFWGLAAHPRKAAEELGERFEDYLKRVLLHPAPLAAPRDVAWFLASYAREARARIGRADLPALASVRKALEEAVGVRFEGAKGDEFFRSTLVQTLFYGVFSAWVLWSKRHPSGSLPHSLPSPPGRGDGGEGSRERFRWQEAAWYLRVPMIQVLFEQIATPTRLGPLGIEEVLDWTAGVLDRVDRACFFEQFVEGEVVQYFYEPFLEAFDPALRKDLGVWYTPPEVVRYMVARVDAVLREELGRPDGLASPDVYVLDPCCGTGAYLVETLRTIGATLRQKGGDALVAEDLKRKAMTRVFGFEILLAPFVVAHLQIGLLLQGLGAPLSDARKERPGVYLTNALSGWTLPTEPTQRSLFPEMEEERKAAERVKRDAPILVILGNPPYNGYAGVAVEEDERNLTDAYRTVRRAPPPEGRGLNDLYVRFFRMAERRIVEKTGQGIVCFISNYSWLDGRSFTGMRERYLDKFDRIWIDCLNGDKYKTGKLTPEGEPDPSIFSTESNREGIQVGTAITLLVRKVRSKGTRRVAFRHFWGKEKRAALDEAAKHREQKGYRSLAPAAPMGLPFIPARAASPYFAWPRLPDLFPASYPGVKTSRDDFVVGIDRDRLLARLEKYFDRRVSHEEMRRTCPGVMEDRCRFQAEDVRDSLLRRGFVPGRIVRYCYRPFDLRWLYWEPETKLLDEKREDYFPHVFEGNVWLSSAQRTRKASFHQPQFTTQMAALHLVESGASMFPLYLASPGGAPVRNVGSLATAYLAAVSREARDLFHHTLAILHAPAYASENLGPLRQDWPRLPLPRTGKGLDASASLGETLSALLDVEADVPGVTTGRIRPELRSLGTVSAVGKRSVSVAEGDLDITAGWGHAGKGGVAMPARGKVVPRGYTPEERSAIEEGAKALGLPARRVFDLLGGGTCDIYLNDFAYWQNVPTRVWEYALGGYPVIKKWLSYRERDLLGRGLTLEEAREVTNMARRIAAVLLLGPTLDASYAKAKDAAWTEPTDAPEDAEA